MGNRETAYWRRNFLGGAQEKPSRSEEEEEEDDEWLIKLLQERHTPPVAVPGRVSSPKTVRAPSPKPPVRVSAPDGISRRKMSDILNKKLRLDYKEGPQARGDKYFDQSKKSKDFKRTEKFTKDSPGKVKQIDPNEKLHKSRKLHREMRARTKGGQFKDPQQLRNYIRMVEEGYKHGKKMRGQWTWRQAADHGLRQAASKAGPAGAVVAAGYGGYKLGEFISGFTSAGKREAARKRDQKIRKERIALAKQIYPNQPEHFYKNLAQEMFNEEHRGDKLTVDDLTDAMKIMQELEELEAIEDGTARAFMREMKGK